MLVLGGQAPPCSSVDQSCLAGTKQGIKLSAIQLVYGSKPGCLSPPLERQILEATASDGCDKTSTGLGEGSSPERGEQERRFLTGAASGGHPSWSRTAESFVSCPAPCSSPPGGLSSVLRWLQGGTTGDQALPAQHIWGNQPGEVTELLQTQISFCSSSSFPSAPPLPKATRNIRPYPLPWPQPPLPGAAPSPAAAAPAPAGGASGAPPSPAGGTTPSRPGCARRPPTRPGERTRNRRSEGLGGARLVSLGKPYSSPGPEIASRDGLSLPKARCCFWCQTHREIEHLWLEEVNS